MSKRHQTNVDKDRHKKSMNWHHVTSSLESSFISLATTITSAHGNTSNGSTIAPTRIARNCTAAVALQPLHAYSGRSDRRSTGSIDDFHDPNTKLLALFAVRSHLTRARQHRQKALQQIPACPRASSHNYVLDISQTRVRHPLRPQCMTSCFGH